MIFLKSLFLGGKMIHLLFQEILFDSFVGFNLCNPDSVTKYSDYNLHLLNTFLIGAASLNAKMNGMIALRTITYFLVTSLIAALIGLALVLIIHPGNPETKGVLGEGKTANR